MTEVRLSLLGLLVGLLTVVPCRADEKDDVYDDMVGTQSSPDDETAALVDQAKALARQKKWEEALPLFQKAYERQQSYDVVGNLGITEHELGLDVQAANHLSLALAGFPVDGPPIKRQALVERLAEVKTKVVEIQLAVDPSTACVQLNEEDVGCGPFNESLFAKPDEPIALRASAPGHRVALAEKKAGAGETISVTLTLPPYDVEPSPSALATTPGSGDAGSEPLLPAWPGYVVAGSGLVAAIVGGVLLSSAEGLDTDTLAEVEDLRLTTGERAPCIAPTDPTIAGRCSTLADDLSRLDTFHNVGLGLVVGGLGLVGVGGALFAMSFVDDDEAKEAASYELVPSVGWGQAGISWRGRW